MKNFILLLCFALCWVAFAAAAQAPPPEKSPLWIGFRYQVESTEETAEQTAGLRVIGLPFASPAKQAGLRVGDLIVRLDGRAVRLPPEADADTPQELSPAAFLRQIMEEKSAGDVVVLTVVRDEVAKSAMLQGQAIDDAALWLSPEDYLLAQPVGTTAELRGNRQRRIIEVAVHVQPRPAGIGEPKILPDAAQLARAFPAIDWPEEALAEELLEEFAASAGYRDLRARLARLNANADPFRLSRVAHIQHQPFQLRTAGAEVFAHIEQALKTDNRGALLDLAAAWLDTTAGPPLEPLQRDLTLDGHLQQLLDLFAVAAAHREAAFSPLSAAERAFLDAHLDSVGAPLAQGISPSSDPDSERLANNERVMALATRVDFAALFAGARVLWQVAEPDYLAALETAVRREWAARGEPEDVFVRRDSPFGQIKVGGHGNYWYRQDAAIIIDLAGDDVYTNNAGAARGDTLPISLLIDFSGDDSYESTVPWVQGAGRLGYGVLIDRQGNDRYLAPQWAQGAAALGVALFLDEAGHDLYRLGRYGQGAGLWGIGIHLDLAGDDRYEARLLAQGVGLPGGAGWLIDAGGNDHYYAKGENPTNYGDAGIFDSWSQGCGLGFRHMQSGGIGLLFDAAGADRYEAGNFSQGGGYYFGIGLLRDGGRDDDVYLGSRYNQGFSAHQALGYFEEMGGNDLYQTRQGVAQGVAWDESITLFIDHGGDDHYQGGESFSQGASAHNSISIFLDLAGRDRYAHPPGQGRSGPNDYHGGTSFSLFVDAAGRWRNDKSGASIELSGESGISARLPLSLEKILRRDRWRHYLRRP